MRKKEQPQFFNLPPGYVAIRSDELKRLLSGAVTPVRMASLLAASQERAIVDGLLPTLRTTVSAMVRHMAKRQSP